MTHFGTIILGIALSLLSATTKNIEKAFLQDGAGLLFSQFSGRTSVNLSFPEPISFSDQVSPEQAYFIFRNVFASYSTFEFYAESEFPFPPAGNHFIFQARWSFKNIRTNNQTVFRVFFYLIKEFPVRSGRPVSPGGFWKVREIRAEAL